MRFWMWLGTFLLFGLGVGAVSFIVHLELLEPGPQYIHETNTINAIITILGPLSYLVAPHFVILALLAVCAGPSSPLQKHEFAAVALGTLGAIFLVVAFLTPWDRLATALSYGVIFASAASILLGWIIALRQQLSLGSRPLTWGRWVGICCAASGLAVAVATALALFLLVNALLDRNFGTAFFDGAAPVLSDPLLYQHLLWFLGHPEAAIQFPIAFVLSLIVATLIWGCLKAFRLKG